MAVLALLLSLGACSTVPTSGSSIRSSTGSSTSPSASPSASLPPSLRWKVVALGDSVTSGFQCNCTPFPQLYAQEVTHSWGVPTTAQNLGVNGLNSQQLLADLQNGSSQEARAVAGANIDLVTIGANDFMPQQDDVTKGVCTGDCVSDQLVQMQQNVTQLIQRIHVLRAGRPTAILVTGYWNVFQDGAVARANYPAAGRAASLQLTARANQGIKQATEQARATYVDLYRPFNGPAAQGDITSLLAGDGDHPNARGQQLIADALLAAGLHGLVKG